MMWLVSHYSQREICQQLLVCNGKSHIGGSVLYFHFKYQKMIKIWNTKVPNNCHYKILKKNIVPKDKVQIKIIKIKIFINMMARIYFIYDLHYFTPFITNCYNIQLLTVLPLPWIISGAIQPSVPVIPDRLENEVRPLCNFLHSPKSDIIALTCPLLVGIDNNTLCGLMSRWTVKKNKHMIIIHDNLCSKKFKVFLYMCLYKQVFIHVFKFPLNFMENKILFFC